MAVTASEARARLFPLIEQVNNDHDAVHIISKHGDAYLVSGDEWRSLMETAHLLRSPVNARRLMDALEELHDAGGEKHELDRAGEQRTA